MTDPETSMRGKVCLVTGATGGIGAVTARELARRQATVVVVGRSRERAEATVDRIRSETGNPAVDFLLADLSVQADIRRLAEQFRERYDRLDVLINNAGGIFTRRERSADGFEMTFAVNHLAYFLLTNLLLDVLRDSAPARIIVVSSDAHRRVSIDFDHLQGRPNDRGFLAYSRSKLANLLFTYELARRLDGTGVTVNALHPGFVATNIFAGHGVPGWIVRRIASVVGLSPEDGAKTTISLATAPEVEGVTGRYFEKQTPVESSPASRDEEAARRLWQISEELTGLSTRSTR